MRQDGNSEKEEVGREREREKERDEEGSGKKDREKRGWTPRCQVAR